MDEKAECDETAAVQLPQTSQSPQDNGTSENDPASAAASAACSDWRNPRNNHHVAQVKKKRKKKKEENRKDQDGRGSKQRKKAKKTEKRKKKEKEKQKKDWERETKNKGHLLCSEFPKVWRNPDAGYVSRCDIKFQRVVDADYPTLPYRRRKGEEKTVVHWGQRKLLLSEIEFLTLYGQEGHPVVYAGAAPGELLAAQLSTRLLKVVSIIFFQEPTSSCWQNYFLSSTLCWWTPRRSPSRCLME